MGSSVWRALTCLRRKQHLSELPLIQSFPCHNSENLQWASLKPSTDCEFKWLIQDHASSLPGLSPQLLISRHERHRKAYASAERQAPSSQAGLN